MGVPFKLVGFSSREEILSSDLVRVQKIVSQSLQNELEYASLDSNNNPINCFTQVPVITPIASTLNVSFGAGEAMVNDSSGVGADDSLFKVMQWPVTNPLTFVTPDPTNTRIDLIVATPATVSGDIQSRNILVDPVARTVSAANVSKTSTPTATIAVVTGTPSATPAPPAVPSGAFALYEVAVIGATTDATQWTYSPRLFRRTAFPLTGSLGHAPQHGIVRGCDIISGVIGGSDNAVLIDGEVLEFGSVPRISDSTANPFGTNAPAGNDRPFFYYLAGGRSLPQNNAAFTGPVCLIASTVPPVVRTGRPSAPITTPRGATQSATYVGVGFVLKGTTTLQTCFYQGDVVYWASVTATDPQFEAQTGLGAGNLTLASAPSISDRVILQVFTIGGAGTVFLRLPGMPTSNPLWWRSYGGAVTSDGNIDLPIAVGAGPHLAYVVGGTTASLAPVGYSMKVRKI